MTLLNNNRSIINKYRLKKVRLFFEMDFALNCVYGNYWTKESMMIGIHIMTEISSEGHTKLDHDELMKDLENLCEEAKQ